MGAARLVVDVVPGARAEAIRIVDGRVAVRVRARPVDGAANDAVRRLLAQTLRVPLPAVRLARGISSRTKCFEIDGVAPADLANRLRRAEEQARES